MDLSENLFLEKAEEIANYISNQQFIRIFSHNDADGIISASILMNALRKKKIKYQTSFISKIEISFFNKYKGLLENEVVIFSDIGSSYIEQLKNINENIIILDHHKYKNKKNILLKYLLNPEDYNISGSFFCCASTICYFIAKFIDSDNKYLSSLALIGIDGDRQTLKLLNELVLNDALDNNFIDQKYGYKLGDGFLYDILNVSIEPYFKFNGNMKEIKLFFSKRNILNKKISEFNMLELENIKKILHNELIKYDCSDSIKFIFGDYYILSSNNRFPIKNIHDLSLMISSCGQVDKPGLGASLCLYDYSNLEEINKITIESKKCLILNLQNILKTKTELNNLYYFIGKNIYSSGEIASSISRYIYSSKVIICFNENINNIKISGRCSYKLVENGIDLSTAFNIATNKVGGSGGGHSIASGGIIPIGAVESFVKELDIIFDNQLKKYN